MWFETLIREETGCAAYMIGCQGTGQCAVFDPVWDIQPYLDMAREKDSTIQYVIDSHSHADHVASLPIFLETIYGMRETPVEIWGSAETIACLRSEVGHNRKGGTPYPSFLCLNSGSEAMTGGTKQWSMPAADD